MKQNYKLYTEEDQKVWNALFTRQIRNLEKHACKEYLKGIQNVGFDPKKIPDFEEVKENFKKSTGWTLHVVPGIIPVEEFFPLLNEKKFSATTWLRKMNQLDYIEEPDMFHDVFGHVPLLSIPSFSEFVLGLSKIAIEHLNDPEIMERLGRIYWFTLEFGLIFEENELKVYGAGICSSSGEVKHALSSSCDHKPFDVKEIMNTPFQNDRIQNLYFVIKSFDELFNSLSEINNEITRVKCEEKIT